MTARTFTESVVKQAALASLQVSVGRLSTARTLRRVSLEPRG